MLPSSRENTALLAINGAHPTTRSTRFAFEQRLATTPARCAVLLLVLFLVVTLSLQLPVVRALDRTCSTWLCGLGGPYVTQASRLLARVGSTGLYLAVPFMAFVGWCCGGIKGLKTYALLLAGHGVLLALTKFLIARPRPDSRSLTTHLDSYPSGHTMIAVILAGSLLLFVLPRCAQRWQRGLIWAITLLWPLLMGLSRVQWGRHYVTDVLAAYLLGIAWLLLCVALTDWASTLSPPPLLVRV